MSENIAQVLYHSAQETPDRDAIVLLASEEERTVTFLQLLQGAARYAQAYRLAGISQGEPIILLFQHGLDLIEAFFGAVMHGCVPSIMPFLTEKLSPERYRESLQALVDITKPAALVTYPEFEGEVLRAKRDGDSVRVILLSSEIPQDVDGPMDGLLGLVRSPEDLVLLQHSSGTTGLQKGVALSHQAVLNQIASYGQAIEMRDDDVVVSWLPLYHDMGLIAGFIMPILLRATLVLMSPFDWVRAPYRLFQAVSEFGGTLTWLPNFAYNFCSQKVRDRDLEGVDLSSWRGVINCSEPMRWDSHEQFRTRFQPYGFREEALATCYAMAENVFAVTQGGISEPVVIDLIDPDVLSRSGEAVLAADSGACLPMLSAGRPIANTRLRIVDDHGSDVPDRTVGEIALQGDCLLSGYYNRPDLTSDAFRDGWYLTGDLGYLADGELYVTGRLKEIIIVGGKNIYPQDLEYLAADVPGVHPGRVVALGVFNEDVGTEEIAIIAEVEEEGEAERSQIARELRARIAQGTDTAVRFVETVDPGWLIKTSSGKIARGANLEKYLKERAEGGA